MGGSLEEGGEGPFEPLDYAWLGLNFQQKAV